MLYLARAAAELAAPFSLALLLLIGGLVLLLAGKRRLALLCNGLGVAILLVFGYGLWVEDTFKARERQYLPLAADGVVSAELRGVDYIVVLGSGHVSDPALPATTQIGGAALYRIVEAKRLLRLLPEATVVLTGGIVYDPVPHAEVVREVAMILDIDRSRLYLEDRPRSTSEEAEYLAELLGGGPFILVTSASHMKRAMDIFRDRGMQPLPAPTDYVFKEQSGRSGELYLPRPGNLELGRRLIYEYLGDLWVRSKQLLERYRS